MTSPTARIPNAAVASHLDMTQAPVRNLPETPHHYVATMLKKSRFFKKTIDSVTELRHKRLSSKTVSRSSVAPSQFLWSLRSSSGMRRNASAVSLVQYGLATAHLHPKILIIMGIADIREVIRLGCGGYLDVRDVGLRYAKDGRQILQFTGWHRDGTPFAFVSAAFAGGSRNTCGGDRSRSYRCSQRN